MPYSEISLSSLSPLATQVSLLEAVSGFLVSLKQSLHTCNNDDDDDDAITTTNTYWELIVCELVFQIFYMCYLFWPS